MSVPVIHAGGIVTREQQVELATMEQEIIQAVAKARKAGVPQGFIVSILYAHAQMQTNRLIEAAP